MHGGSRGVAFAEDTCNEDGKCRAHTGVEIAGVTALEFREFRDHRRRPEGAQVIGDARDRLLIGEADAVGGDLPGHPGEGLDAHG